MDLIKMISTFLLILGGLNWGLYGVLHIDLIQVIFGGFGIVATVIYALVGLSAVHFILQGKLLPNG